MRYLKQNKLYCFSPPVMIATFVIEIILALYTLFRYKLNELLVVILLLLTMLGLFQYSEYNVCTEVSELWSRIGYVAITTLPTLGIHLFYLLTSNKSRILVSLSYAAMTIITCYFVFAPNIFTSYVCTGNYVIFGLSATSTIYYSLYYFGLLFLSLALSIYWLAKHPKSKSKRKLLEAFVAGYGLFLLPTITLITLIPQTSSAIPSIMCGFAVIFALILAVYIAPRALLKNKK